MNENNDLDFILELETNQNQKEELDVVFTAFLMDDDILLIDKEGFDADLLFSPYLGEDCGLEPPEENCITGATYVCKNLRVVNESISLNPENPDVSYDLQCDWELLFDPSDVLSEYFGELK